MFSSASSLFKAAFVAVLLANQALPVAAQPSRGGLAQLVAGQSAEVAALRSELSRLSRRHEALVATLDQGASISKFAKRSDMTHAQRAAHHLSVAQTHAVGTYEHHYNMALHHNFSEKVATAAGNHAVAAGHNMRMQYHQAITNQPHIQPADRK